MNMQLVCSCGSLYNWFGIEPEFSKKENEKNNLLSNDYGYLQNELTKSNYERNEYLHNRRFIISDFDNFDIQNNKNDSQIDKQKDVGTNTEILEMKNININTDLSLIKPFIISNRVKKTLYIYDWDNTLYPSTYIAENILNNNEQQKITQIEKIIIDLLNQSLKHGLVYIITNADRSWVDQCILKYYPDLPKKVQPINIISARESYQRITSDSILWKVYSFQHYLAFFSQDNSIDKNIICIGDSFDEHIAAKELVKSIKNNEKNDDEKTLLKSIKLQSNPTLDQLYNQLAYLLHSIEFIHSNDSNVHINIGL